MARKVVKLTLVFLMLIGICFSIFNFLALKSEAKVYWQKLEMGDDPHGGTFIRCYETGQACVTVEEPGY